MIIQLTKKQLEKAIDIGKQRHEAKHVSFRNRSIYSSNDGLFGYPKEYSPHIIGAIGEMGWSIYSGEVIDTAIYSVRDSGQDFDELEVKTITYFGNGEPELKIQKREYDKKKPKKYVLARFDLKDKIEILGEITRDNFDLHKKEKRYGRTNPLNYIVPLSKMEKL